MQICIYFSNVSSWKFKIHINTLDPDSSKETLETYPQNRFTKEYLLCMENTSEYKSLFQLFICCYAYNKNNNNTTVCVWFLDTVILYDGVLWSTLLYHVNVIYKNNLVLLIKAYCNSVHRWKCALDLLFANAFIRCKKINHTTANALYKTLLVFFFCL